MNVASVVFSPRKIVVTVVLRRRRLACPHCSYVTSSRYDTRQRPSRWRHLDLGVWQVEIRAQLRRLYCPYHGVVVEGVPFARPDAHLSRHLDDLLAWLATRMDKSSIARLCRVSWRTVGRACERVVASELDPGRLDGLFRIGVDEISWRKQHKYLTLVVDHDRACVIWGASGKDAKTLDEFFDELGPGAPRTERSEPSASRNPTARWWTPTTAHHPSSRVRNFSDRVWGEFGDRYHRRELWQQLRELPDVRWAKPFKGARWALLKKPEDLTERQAEQLAKIRRNRGGIWRVYEMKEQFRAIFDDDLEPAEAIELLDRWISRASRSRLAPFVNAAKTMRQRRGLIINALEHGINNGRVEGLNTKVRLIIRRGYGFHTADAALALVMLACGPITLQLPHEHHHAKPVAQAA